MKVVASCLVGFAVGWGARAVLDSGRDAIVSLTAMAYGVAEAARRHAGFEKEYFQDMLAEGKARWEAGRRRRAARAAGTEGASSTGAPQSNTPECGRAHP